MSKRTWLFFGIIVVIMMIGGVIGTSKAYFSDTETSVNNPIGAGVWTNPNWYDFAWYYRVPITVTNSGTGVTNYQQKMTLSFVSNHMNSDFSDIRFTASDGTTLLYYWVESYIASTSAIVWVKVPSIAANPTTTTIYMYYGNVSAVSSSSGSNTFQFFDDFEGGSIDGK